MEQSGRKEGLCEDFGIYSEFVGEAGGAFEQRHGNKSISCRVVCKSDVCAMNPVYNPL